MIDFNACLRTYKKKRTLFNIRRDEMYEYKRSNILILIKNMIFTIDHNHSTTKKVEEKKTTLFKTSSV
jgi:hypothetical protein